MTSADDRDRREVNAIVERRDESAFRSLYARHTPALLGIAIRLVDSDQDAEDAVQETWIRAVKNMREFAWGSSLRTWLLGLAVASCREKWTADQRGWKGSRITPVTTVPTADDEAIGAASRVDLERAVASLHPGSRALLLFHDVLGWTPGAIAQLLGIDEALAKSQLVSARLAIRRKLAEQDTVPPTEQ